LTKVSKSLSLAWTKHLSNDKEKEDFGSLVRNSTQVLSRLKAILEEELESQLKQETTLSDFSDPNWPYKQAFRNGSKATLNKLKDLFNYL
jgi:hypothetical protein